MIGRGEERRRRGRKGVDDLGKEEDENLKSAIHPRLKAHSKRERIPAP